MKEKSTLKDVANNYLTHTSNRRKIWVIDKLQLVSYRLL